MLSPFLDYTPSCIFVCTRSLDCVFNLHPRVDNCYSSCADNVSAVLLSVVPNLITVQPSGPLWPQQGAVWHHSHHGYSISPPTQIISVHTAPALPIIPDQKWQIRQLFVTQAANVRTPLFINTSLAIWPIILRYAADTCVEDQHDYTIAKSHAAGFI